MKMLVDLAFFVCYPCSPIGFSWWIVDVLSFLSFPVVTNESELQPNITTTPLFRLDASVPDPNPN
jgi:hypothetical protein